MIEVLFVDDSSEYCEFLRTALGEDPEIHPIGEANNGNDALSFCELALPELILVNAAMPEIDGTPVTKLIKDKYPLVKILAMDGVRVVLSAICAEKHNKARGLVLQKQ